MRNIRLTTVAIIIIASTTSSVFASWWNPTTWKIFNKQTKIQEQVKMATSSSTNQIILCNGSKYKSCTSGQNFICPTNGLEGYCEKVEDLGIKTPIVKEPNIVTETAQASKVSPKPKIIAKVETQNYNYLVIQLIDSLVSSSQKYLDINNEFKSILQSRQQRILQDQTEYQSHVVESVAKGVNIPNDAYRSLVVFAGGEVNIIKLSIAKIDILIKGLNTMVTELQRQKADYSAKILTQEQATFEMKEVMKTYNSLDEIVKFTNQTYQEHVSSSQKYDDTTGRTLSLLKKNADDYAYAASQPKEVYIPIQQVVIPKIELPKTTFCNISYTGIRGNYDVVCNQR